MANVQLKCPCCGGALQFDDKKQLTVCPYCDSEFTAQDLKAYTDELANGIYQEIIVLDTFKDVKVGNFDELVNNKQINLIGDDCFRAFIDSNKRYAIFSKCIHPDQLTPEMVEAFVDKLEADCRGEGAKTLYKRFKKIITAATKQGIFLDNPCDGISAKVEDEGRLKKDVLTADEITRLIQCKFDRQSDDVRRAFLLSLFTGLRYCDVKELRYRNINYEECTLTFQQQKTKRTNTVPLRHDLIALIGRGEPDQLLFHVGSPTACNKALQHWVERAGINKHITWHCARHSFGALTYYNLKDLRATSELLGHADTKVTQIYTKVFDDRKRELVDSLPAIE